MMTLKTPKGRQFIYASDLVSIIEEGGRVLVTTQSQPEGFEVLHSLERLRDDLLHEGLVAESEFRGSVIEAQLLSDEVAEALAEVASAGSTH